MRLIMQKMIVAFCGFVLVSCTTFGHRPKGTRGVNSVSVSSPAIVSSSPSVPAPSVSPTPSADVKLMPKDEAKKDSSFEIFRTRLRRAINDRDAKWIISILDPTILNDLGGSGGIEEFKQKWNPGRADSELWEVLGTVMDMGGSFTKADNSEFCAPYVTSEWPTVVERLPEEADPLDYAVVIGNKVELRKEANKHSPVLGVLSYDVVKLPDFENHGRQWIRVVTLSGREGYVPVNTLRQANDYHACFSKTASGWLMNAFFAGD